MDLCVNCNQETNSVCDGGLIDNGICDRHSIG